MLTFDADGTIDVNIEHNAGSTPPFYTRIQGPADGTSSTFVCNDSSGTSGVAWFSLDNPGVDMSKQPNIVLRADIRAVDVGNDTMSLVAQIFDGNQSVTSLTNSLTLGDELDTTRIQKSLTLTGLTGTQAQWNTAYLKLSWFYTVNVLNDGGKVCLYGLDLFGGTPSETLAPYRSNLEPTRG